jgi:hypothetical protein
MYLYISVLITCICMYLYISVCVDFVNTISLVQIHKDTESCLSIYSKYIQIHKDTVIHTNAYHIETFKKLYVSENECTQIQADSEMHFPIHRYMHLQVCR